MRRRGQTVGNKDKTALIRPLYIAITKNKRGEPPMTACFSKSFTETPVVSSILFLEILRGGVRRQTVSKAPRRLNSGGVFLARFLRGQAAKSELFPRKFPKKT